MPRKKNTDPTSEAEIMLTTRAQPVRLRSARSSIGTVADCNAAVAEPAGS